MCVRERDRERRGGLSTHNTQVVWFPAVFHRCSCSSPLEAFGYKHEILTASKKKGPFVDLAALRPVRFTVPFLGRPINGHSVALLKTCSPRGFDSSPSFFFLFSFLFLFYSSPSASVPFVPLRAPLSCRGCLHLAGCLFCASTPAFSVPSSVSPFPSPTLRVLFLPFRAPSSPSVPYDAYLRAPPFCPVLTSQDSLLTRRHRQPVSRVTRYGGGRGLPKIERRFFWYIFPARLPTRQKIK